MLKNTFLHIPGIGPKTERKIWDSGIFAWDEFASENPIHSTPKKRGLVAGYLQESKQHLISNNPNYFENLLPANLHWRFFPEFRSSAVYLDIETTGLDRHYESITTIALYDGESIFHYVRDQNLDDFLNDIQGYKVLITYNGKLFDVPFIERYFNIKLDHAHIDLRFILGSLGYKGGLKACEYQLGIDRGDLQGVDGFFAVLLWHEYQRNKNKSALETLLAYNIQDVLNLEHLMVTAYNMKIRETPFYESLQLRSPILPDNPFTVDRDTVEKIKKVNIHHSAGFCSTLDQIKT